jgi:hypothetical protein
MKATSIPPGCKLEKVYDVLMALLNRFGEHVYAYFNDYYVDSTMSKEEIIEGYRKHWDSKQIKEE